MPTGFDCWCGLSASSDSIQLSAPGPESSLTQSERMMGRVRRVPGGSTLLFFCFRTKLNRPSQDPPPSLSERDAQRTSRGVGSFIRRSAARQLHHGNKRVRRGARHATAEYADQERSGICFSPCAPCVVCEFCVLVDVARARVISCTRACRNIWIGVCQHGHH